MKISLVQFSPEFGNKDLNIEKITGYIEDIESDIIIFPELATSGYFFLSKEESAQMAEEKGGPVYRMIADMAAKHRKIISYGFPERDGKNIYNSAAVLFPDRSFNRIYRKSHLFYKERFCFEPGDTGFFVIDYKEQDIRIGTMICYDWRFPEASRALALLGADLIICPSNLVTNVWHLVMPARAIENKVYLAVANRCGTEKRKNEELKFKGESAVYGYNGSELAKAGITTEEVITAEIFPEKTRDKSFNEFNDIFRDRRPELYK